MNANGIHPLIAIILTVIFCALTVLLFIHHHIVWGILLAIITLDFFADVMLSFKKA